MVNPEEFPWGLNRPSRTQRILFALVLACLCGMLLTVKYHRFPETRSDFSQARFGADAILHAANPYVLSGPNKVFDAPRPVLYPATAYVVAIPFTLLGDHAASVIFVALSAFLLAYGATAGGWHRLPMFASIAFISSIQFAQWSTLITAAVFLPFIAIIGSVKPQSIIPVVALSERWTAAVAATIGGLILFAVSIVLLPSWPAEWVGIVSSNNDLTPPLFRFGGPVILLVLLRWRRADAWLVALSACMPQTWGWYNTLILLSIARTYREATVLSLSSSAGFFFALYFSGFSSEPTQFSLWGAMMVAFAYLPATIAILRRPDPDDLPAWLASMLSGLKAIRA